jgi:hypothetical protein
MAELNKLGGVLAKTEKELQRAKNVDLITLPLDIDGTNCGNCKYIKERYCTHPRVRQDVNNRMCCVLWSRKGEYRQFKGRNIEYGTD